MRATTEASIPDDLRAAIAANPLAFRRNTIKTPAGRARQIASLVAMLARRETIIPEGGRQTTSEPRA
jgi:uncharacterized protein YdeI (YjbR/CyaY-like superfamily)